MLRPYKGELTLLDGRNMGQEQGSAGAAQQNSVAPATTSIDDDIPF